MMTNEEYHADKAIGKSGLDLIARSPAHFRYAPKREPTRAMTIGSATHCAVLEPHRFATDYVVLPGVDDRRSAIYKQAIAQRGEEYVLTGSEGDRIAGMASAVWANQYAAEMLRADGGRAEQSFFATDPVTGVRVKIRPDWLTADGRCLDLKTTQDASDTGFGKSIVNYRYFVQEAFYRDVYQWATGERMPSFEFLVVESEMPHCCTVVELPADAVEYGRTLYRRNLNTFADCLASGVWPGLPSDPHVIALPSWFVAEIENAQEIV